MPNNAVGGFARTGALFGALVDTALVFFFTQIFLLFNILISM